MRDDHHAGCVIACAALILGLVSSPIWSASSFRRVELGKGASILVPVNWSVLSGSQRLTLDAWVEAQGLKKTASDLPFAANLYDEQGETVALINARFYPKGQLTQADARRATATDLEDADRAIRRAAEPAMKASGLRVTKWVGSKMRVINGRYVQVYEYQYVDPKRITWRTRLLRVWHGPQSFTVTLSYRERDSRVLSPVIDHMVNSLRQR